MGLFETGTYDGGVPTYPNGCHICEVEIDETTGAVELLRYVAVDDCGRVINPLLLEGQMHGGIAQGLGQALMEDMTYDADSGQVMAGSFMDYAMPRADDFCAIEMESNEVLCKTNPLGVKGGGEAGTVGALAVDHERDQRRARRGRCGLCRDAVHAGENLAGAARCEGAQGRRIAWAIAPVWPAR